jgi:hypothetical protein
MGFSIRNAEYVELYIPTGSTKQTYYFPDLPNLRNKPITGIEAFSGSEQSKGQSGYEVVPAANLREAYLVLYFDGGEFIQVPLQSIHRVSTTSTTNGANATFFDIPQLAGQNIVWTKSYVFIADTTNLSGVIAGKEFLFNVYYNR